jgi:DNA-directed RNA polymerase subunit RPC12/RpoP
MTQSTQDSHRLEMRDGEDFVCPNCGSEIMLKHHGDPIRMPAIGPFTCCCGTRMEPEHPEHANRD